MYIYNVNQENKACAISKSLSVKINWLMYGTHGVLNVILQSVKSYISCAHEDNQTLMQSYFDIICVQTKHLLSLGNLIGKNAIFLPYENNTLCCFSENRLTNPIIEKFMNADSVVSQRLLIKNYKRVAFGCKNQLVKQILQSHIIQNQKLIFNLKCKSIKN